jgi:hypothetical protein
MRGHHDIVHIPQCAVWWQGFPGATSSAAP